MSSVRRCHGNLQPSLQDRVDIPSDTSDMISRRSLIMISLPHMWNYHTQFHTQTLYFHELKASLASLSKSSCALQPVFILLTKRVEISGRSKEMVDFSNGVEAKSEMRTSFVGRECFQLTKTHISLFLDIAFRRAALKDNFRVPDLFSSVIGGTAEGMGS